MMRPQMFLLVALLLWATATQTLAAEGAYKLDKTDKPPEGIAEKVQQLLDTTGYSVAGTDGTVCTVWLVKKPDVIANFSPGLSVKYPFKQGDLIGVLQVAKDDTMTDFRGQELPAGAYTLRYGQQPQDGNHVGTSDLADFLLASPAKSDEDTKPITNFDDLTILSAESAGATHPAIFSLQPKEAAIESAKLAHDQGKDFWILELPGTKEEKMSALRLVVIGKSEG